MQLQNLFKLEKLKIKAYKRINRELSDLIDTFEAMFNPESFTQKFEILYGKAQPIGSSDKQQRFAKNLPGDLSLKLLLDGTGTTDIGILPFQTTQKVSERVKKFLDLTFYMNGNIHEPTYLKVEWGDLIFSCRLSSVDINYSNFDRDGSALRATLDIKLVSDQSIEKLNKIEGKNSPDLSHARIVKAGDTLPLLSKEIYGSSTYYLWVAKANDLDDIRNLNPGQQLFFPPLPQDAVSH
jgi:hypothetical protein